MTEQEELEWLRKEVARCHDRLGIDCYYLFNPDLGDDDDWFSFTEVVIPLEERPTTRHDAIYTLELKNHILQDAIKYLKRAVVLAELNGLREGFDLGRSDPFIADEIYKAAIVELEKALDRLPEPENYDDDDTVCMDHE